MTSQTEALAQRAAVLAQIQALVVDCLLLEREPDELDPDAPLFGTGLSLDSLDAVELVVAVEQAFGVRVVEDRDAPPVALRSLNTLVDHVLESAS